MAQLSGGGAWRRSFDATSALWSGGPVQGSLPLSAAAPLEIGDSEMTAMMRLNIDWCRKYQDGTINQSVNHEHVLAVIVFENHC